MLHRMTGMDIAGRESLLPGTMRLLDRIVGAETYNELKGLDSAILEATASYGAWPEINLPFARFHVLEADPALLALTGQDDPGFEVLQGSCGGFQFHWRNDLTRALETEMPILGRFIARLGSEEVVLEHFVLPMLVRHRVRKLWGWIMLGEAGGAVVDMGCLQRALALERTEGAHLVRVSGPKPSLERRRRPGPASPGPEAHQIPNANLGDPRQSDVP